MSEAQDIILLRRSHQRILNDEKLPESIRVANDGVGKGVGNHSNCANGGIQSVVGVKIGSKVHNLFYNALDDAYSLLKQLGVSQGGRDLRLQSLTGVAPELVHSVVQTGIDAPLSPILEIVDPADPSFEI